MAVTLYEEVLSEELQVGDVVVMWERPHAPVARVASISPSLTGPYIFPGREGEVWVGHGPRYRRRPRNRAEVCAELIDLLRELESMK